MASRELDCSFYFFVFVQSATTQNISSYWQFPFMQCHERRVERMKTAAIEHEEYLRGAISSARQTRAIDVNRIRGWAYCRAAEDDERNGSPFTAASEWHRAAHCFASESVTADRCWREWERIMRIPRALANFVIDTQEAVLPL
jgi:hypothetical protein